MIRGAWAPCKSTRVERHAPLLSPKSIIQDTEHVYQAGLSREQCNTRPPRVEIGGVSLARAPITTVHKLRLASRTTCCLHPAALSQNQQTARSQEVHAPCAGHPSTKASLCTVASTPLFLFLHHYFLYHFHREHYYQYYKRTI